MIRITIIILVIILSSGTIFSQSMLKKIEGLNLKNDKGTINIYYSDGYSPKANRIKEVLLNSKKYFEKEFDIKNSFALAVLEKNQWNKVTNIPYGLPFVSGPPYIVCLPATTEHELAGVIRKAISSDNMGKSLSDSEEELIDQFITFIGFHELGHIYSKELGIKYNYKWVYEFIATYLAYLYLDNHQPEFAESWFKISNKLFSKIQPKYTSLSDFEKLYVKVGVENYAWYQVVFLLRVKEVIEEADAKFVNHLLEAELKGENENLGLDRMEKVHPGFYRWAENNTLIHK